TTESVTLSLHDALPICAPAGGGRTRVRRLEPADPEPGGAGARRRRSDARGARRRGGPGGARGRVRRDGATRGGRGGGRGRRPRADRKSTRLNSRHMKKS